MTSTERILDMYEQNNILLYPWATANDPTTIEMDERFAVFINLSQINSRSELKQVLVHEFGHCMTGTTHRVYSPLGLVQRHEFAANKYAILQFAPIEEFQEAFAAGYCSEWELAEWFDLPEVFIRMAWDYYSENRFIKNDIAWQVAW